MELSDKVCVRIEPRPSEPPSPYAPSCALCSSFIYSSLLSFSTPIPRPHPRNPTQGSSGVRVTQN
ncbi:hypothetical protein E2C01_051120 [Portunus trituberculatus]|uniref:Uncharacterized protein n=1 Tax=Portunus trituberculatus TaxID=210409 RepID=A0A5B7GHR6_PORTR|nr:hypothetical protein [Portunus trituberculatus]